MPKQHIHTQIDERKLKLSNPQKILYPDAKITKAEVIQYFLHVAPTMLPHISHRPITLIRFPDGIDKPTFYAKNKPTWTPDWIASTVVGDDIENDYVLVTERATIVWIANLAGLEIHPMNMRASQINFPDQIIFDLDPSAEVDFEALKVLAKKLGDFLKENGYQAYIKTSGGKGLHIYVPIKAIYHKDEVYRTTESLAKKFIALNKELTTLRISKQKRVGKVLIDIYRNRSSQSCVAPYSLRGKPNAPVSMPFHWNELDALKSSQQWNIENSLERLQAHGDAWADIWTNATPLHSAKKIVPATLETYNDKRDFTKTTEPDGLDPIRAENQYVVQLHDASNLHYDLRLSYNGVLVSWALPKGMPEKPGVKRLGIQTEDHPLKYLDFEGTIPKEEYGGGTMWIFDRGSYELVKKTDKKYHFKLLDGGLKGEYVIYNTRDKQWIIERKDVVPEWTDKIFKPMLASLGEKIPSKKAYFYEIKWDGIRALFHINHGQLTIYSRNGNDITAQFPELSILTKHIEAETALLDGEIVHLDEKGRPQFSKIVGRIHVVGEKSIALAAKKTPAVAYLFDLIHLDGKDCRPETNERRRSWLRTILTSGETVRFSDTFPDGQDLMEAITLQKMEGIICKRKDGKYASDGRNSSWVKVKVKHEDVAYIIGYTRGEGDRQELMGAMHLAQKQDNQWIYMGKVGTGYTNKKLKELYGKLSAVPKTKKIVKATIEDEKSSTWIEPVYQCEITYASMSSNGTYREPVFRKMYETSEGKGV